MQCTLYLNGPNAPIAQPLIDTNKVKNGALIASRQARVTNSRYVDRLQVSRNIHCDLTNHPQAS